MSLINVNNINKSFGDTLLFDKVSFEIDEKDKIGLVGVNGAGKTSLFKILTGELSQDGGDFFKHKSAILGYMEQQTGSACDGTLFDEMLQVFSPLIAIEEELEKIHTDMEHGKGNMEQLLSRSHRLSEQFEALGGLVYKSRARAVLLGLGFSEEAFLLPSGVLSGGQRTKMMLGKLLLSRPDLLLLDEPTNHLDIAAVQWLEGFLIDYKGALMVISHDRYFLDKVTNRTFALENQTLHVYRGNYSAYVAQKAQAQAQIAAQYQNTQKEIKRIEGIIAQQKQWNRERNIKTAESKQKMIDRLEKTLIKPSSDPEQIKFSFSDKQRGGNDVLMIEDLKKSFDHKLLFDNVHLHIKRGERIFLLGANGCGKTTLFKIIMGQISSDTGLCRLGTNIEA